MLSISKILILCGVSIPIILAIIIASTIFIYNSISNFYILSSLLLIVYGLDFLEIIKPIDWIRHKVRVCNTLINAIDILYNGSIDKGEPRFSINDSDRSASIVYKRQGNEYILNVPYNRKIRAKMSSFDIFLVKKGTSDEEFYININQQPGLPYLVSANDLGGDRIEIKQKTDGQLIKVYLDNEIPNVNEW
jgi:hypothetical protein